MKKFPNLVQLKVPIIRHSGETKFIALDDNSRFNVGNLEISLFESGSSNVWVSDIHYRKIADDSFLIGGKPYRQLYYQKQ